MWKGKTPLLSGRRFALVKNEVEDNKEYECLVPLEKDSKDDPQEDPCHVFH